jgi:hypothetical protein
MVRYKLRQMNSGNWHRRGWICRGQHAGGCFTSREFPRLNRDNDWFTMIHEDDRLPGIGEEDLTSGIGEEEGGLPGICEEEDGLPGFSAEEDGLPRIGEED